MHILCKCDGMFAVYVHIVSACMLTILKSLTTSSIRIFELCIHKKHISAHNSSILKPLEHNCRDPQN